MCKRIGPKKKYDPRHRRTLGRITELEAYHAFESDASMCELLVRRPRMIPYIHTCLSLLRKNFPRHSFFIYGSDIGGKYEQLVIQVGTDHNLYLGDERDPDFLALNAFDNDWMEVDRPRFMNRRLMVILG